MDEDTGQPLPEKRLETLKEEARAALQSEEATPETALSEDDATDDSSPDALSYQVDDEILENIPKDELLKMRLEAKQALGDRPRETFFDLDTQRLKKQVSKLETEALSRGKKMADNIGHHIDPRNKTQRQIRTTGSVRPQTHMQGISAPANPAISSLEKLVSLRTSETKMSPPVAAVETMRKDVLEGIKSKQISLANIAIAEQELRRRREQQAYLNQTRRWQNLVVGLGLIFVLLGGTVMSYYAFFHESAEEPVPETVADREYLVTPDKEKIVDARGFSERDVRNEFESAVRSATEPVKSITVIVFSMGENNKMLPAKDLLAALFPNTPDKLLRNIGDKYMAGFYTGESRNHGFLALSIDSFENALEGTREWERMDFSRAYELLTTLNASPDESGLEWHDASIRNTDVRVLEDPVRDTYLVYSFLDRETLVFTTDKTAFVEILARFRTPQKVLR